MTQGAGSSEWDALGTVDWLTERDFERVPRDVKFCRERMVAAAVSLGTAAPPPGVRFLGLALLMILGSLGSVRFVLSGCVGWFGSVLC